jgi:polyphosphate kinase
MTDTYDETLAPGAAAPQIPLESPAAFNRELSWLACPAGAGATEDPDLPILERVKFVGIMGMLHDEMFMKRMRAWRQVRLG